MVICFLISETVKYSSKLIFFLKLNKLNTFLLLILACFHTICIFSLEYNRRVSTFHRQI